MPRTLKTNPDIEQALRRSVAARIRHAMIRDDVSFRDLAQRLNQLGFEENERNLRNKVGKGEMQAYYYALLLQIMDVEERAKILHGIEWDHSKETGYDEEYPASGAKTGGLTDTES